MQNNLTLKDFYEVLTKNGWVFEPTSDLDESNIIKFKAHKCVTEFMVKVKVFEDDVSVLNVYFDSFRIKYWHGISESIYAKDEFRKSIYNIEISALLDEATRGLTTSVIGTYDAFSTIVLKPGAWLMIQKTVYGMTAHKVDMKGFETPVLDRHTKIYKINDKNPVEEIRQVANYIMGNKIIKVNKKVFIY